MSEPAQLTPENSFKHRCFMDTANKLSREDAIAALDTLYRSHLAAEQVYKEMIAHQWQIPGV